MQDKFICLPQRMPTINQTMNISSNVDGKPSNLNDNPVPAIVEMKGLKTNLDIQQYNYINEICYERALHWYAKYLPYLILIHTLIFMVCSNFWFKFPGSSSKIEHFVSILGKCFDSPWTTRALSEVSGEKLEDKDRAMAMDSGQTGQGDIEMTESLVPVAEKVVLDKSNTSVLDKKEGEQAKALFEKIKKFRLHVEEGDLLYIMYVRQNILKVFNFLLIIVYNSVFVPYIKTKVRCEADIQEMTGYKNFLCNHTKAHLFSRLAYCYLCFVSVYGVTCLYTLYWVFHRSLKEYLFEYVRQETGIDDIPDVKNDFAFMLHMIDQYDPLYSKRLAVFLSEVSENKLRQVNLNHEWTTDKLRQKLQTNSNNRLELQLFMLSGLPDTTFEVTELQSLRLEIINNVTIPASISQLKDLQELTLYQCSLNIHSAAVLFLKENLKVLRVKFDDSRELPSWIYCLQNLEELYLCGSLNSDISRSITLESMRDLKGLKTLYLKSNLSKIPQSVVDLSSHLQRLCIHNDGTKLVIFNNLKKMAHLTELELVHCQLDRIPHAIFSLTNLQELDLKENNLRSIEEILSFQHLRKLTCLKLWHNSISHIPEHIKKLGSLERLYLNNNKIQVLPAQLFLCRKLRYMDLSSNEIYLIPPEIGVLQSLQYLSLCDNKLETLPDELFFCKKLKILKLGGNLLTMLSPKISNLLLLSHLELKGNHFESLPEELGSCPALKRSGLVVEDILFDTLPSDIREKLEDE